MRKKLDFRPLPQKQELQPDSQSRQYSMTRKMPYQIKNMDIYVHATLNDDVLTVMLLGKHPDDETHITSMHHRMSGLPELDLINSQQMLETFICNSPSANNLICCMLIGYFGMLGAIESNIVETLDLDALKNIKNFLEAPENV